MNPKILAIIPARGGSKGVPRKNIRDLAGKPLIAWTIEEAKKSKYITRLILSSDDDEIIEIAKRYGCEVPFKRPAELAKDDTPGIETVLHTIEKCPGYDYVVLLQPTSPLRTVEDIDECIEFFINKNIDFCVSVTQSEKSPYWMYKVDKSADMKPLIHLNEMVTRRQDLPASYALNGAIYIAKVDKLLQERSFLNLNTKAFIMCRENSFDIDTELDFFICEQLLLKRKKK
ncbi:acylneuraminate cytidylyltransferase family protein [Ureibacillus thermosphaericus]|uniref:CMP-N-acetylneuraminic acid synthetase n=1 Tax=Ureibacillus thermosphaericus TaxID=51173 RepID=A0A840PWQ8_URETH|nr:acylneuraminate cytidylyltransferase family protein [Ureibacillus thermosphaericus]MBB5149734.1 CMP-N-acetylneuraminic acid synthetase [Ureibacillus thermosphaericus]NKZ32633.1 acylneuraminate cytidylyltransferase family protein [Ureibacillus thermosphaericus]